MPATGLGLDDRVDELNAAWIAILGLAAMAAGYRYYSKFLAERVFRLDPEYETPSRAMKDGLDYVPTHRFVLWGHHFTAVAGAAPIIGPGIAVIWGWVPAFLWVVLGTVFLAGVHDFGAIWASVRNRARSIGALTGDVVGERARNLFMVVIFLLLLMVNAVFAVAIAEALQATPSSVIPAWSAVAVALVIGVLIYRLRVKILWPTVVGTAILYLVIYVGELAPVTLPQDFLGLSPGPQWILILFAYAAAASLLPVWLLLQPRDYINGVQLFIGLGLLYGAVLLARPVIVAPAFNFEAPAGTPPIAPLLFVTIACGAISGFHGLVGSGTTSKQLDKETDARFVGYIGSSGEGALALMSIVAATAGFASTAEWHGVYHEFGNGGLEAFVTGGSLIVSTGTGLSREFAATLLTVMAVLFAGTTMDAGVRLQRYIVQEWGTIYDIAPLRNGYVATMVAVASCLALAFGAGGAAGTGGMILWPLFGTTNQILAGLTLLVISVILVKRGHPSRYTLIPMVFVTSMAFLSALYQLWDLFQSRNYLLAIVDMLIVLATVWVMLEAASALARERRERAVGNSAAAEGQPSQPRPIE